MNQTQILWNQNRKISRQLRARNSYLLGVVSGFRDKLDLNRKSMQKETTTNLALISKKDPELESFVRTRHPRLVKISHSGRMNSAAHYHLGREHGSTLVLNKGIKESKGFLGKLLTGRRG